MSVRCGEAKEATKQYNVLLQKKKPTIDIRCYKIIWCFEHVLTTWTQKWPGKKLFLALFYLLIYKEIAASTTTTYYIWYLPVFFVRQFARGRLQHNIVYSERGHGYHRYGRCHTLSSGFHESRFVTSPLRLSKSYLLVPHVHAHLVLTSQSPELEVKLSAATTHRTY